MFRQPFALMLKVAKCFPFMILLLAALFEAHCKVGRKHSGGTVVESQKVMLMLHKHFPILNKVETSHQTFAFHILVRSPHCTKM